MIALERFIQGAEEIAKQKPRWLDWLPEDPSQIIMEFVPNDPDYSIVITKPVIVPGEIETMDVLNVTKQEIDSAYNWLDFAYFKIDRNDRKIASTPDFVAITDDARKRVVTVLAFARLNHKPKSAQLQLSA